MMQVSVREVKLKSSTIDLVTGLARSTLLPWAPMAIDSSLIMPRIAEMVPLSSDVVEWMQLAAADIATFEAMAQEYNRLGSELLTGSGDAYIPGVRAGDVRAESVSGYTVRDRGYGRVITPDGTFNVPIGGKVTFAKGNTLAWAVLTDTWWVQWYITLLYWKSLAKAPIRDRVRFAGSYGHVAPNFFSIPSTIAPVRTLVIGLTSDKSQNVVIKGRGVRGEYERVIFENSVKIDAGQSEVILNVFALPFVGPFTLEIQPSDNTQTVLDYIEILPPI